MDFSLLKFKEVILVFFMILQPTIAQTNEEKILTDKGNELIYFIAALKVLKSNDSSGALNVDYFQKIADRFTLNPEILMDYTLSSSKRLGIYSVFALGTWDYRYYNRIGDELFFAVETRSTKTKFPRLAIFGASSERALGLTALQIILELMVNMASAKNSPDLKQLIVHLEKALMTQIAEAGSGEGHEKAILNLCYLQHSYTEVSDVMTKDFERELAKAIKIVFERAAVTQEGSGKIVKRQKDQYGKERRNQVDYRFPHLAARILIRVFNGASDDRLRLFLPAFTSFVSFLSRTEYLDNRNRLEAKNGSYYDFHRGPVQVLIFDQILKNDILLAAENYQMHNALTEWAIAILEQRGNYPDGESNVIRKLHTLYLKPEFRKRAMLFYGPLYYQYLLRRVEPPRRRHDMTQLSPRKDVSFESRPMPMNFKLLQQNKCAILFRLN